MDERMKTVAGQTMKSVLRENRRLLERAEQAEEAERKIGDYLDAMTERCLGAERERDEAMKRAEMEADAFRTYCKAIQQIEDIVNIDTGGGMGPDPAIEAVRRVVNERDEALSHIERGEQAERERDALAAFADDFCSAAYQASEAMDDSNPDQCEARHRLDHFRYNLQHKRTQSLERLKHQWQAEELEAIYAEHAAVNNGLVGIAALKRRAEKLRTQAQGGAE